MGLLFIYILMKQPFNDLFEVKDQKLTSKITLKIADILMKPGEFHDDVIFLGKRIVHLTDSSFEVKEIEGVKMVLWIYD